MGTIGNTQGVNASNRPATKNTPIITQRLSLAITLASRACSETGAFDDGSEDRSLTVVAAGRLTVMTIVCGR